MTLRSRRLGSLRSVLVFAAAAMALTAGAVVAVTPGGLSEEAAAVSTADEVATVAEGESRAGSRWVLAAGTRPDGADGAGREGFCVSLRVAGAAGPTTSVGCGAMVPGRLAASVAEDVGADAGLIFGTAPEAAGTVSVLADGGSTQFETFDDDRGLPGRFYVVDDGGGDYRQTPIVFRDDRGRELERPAAISELLARTW